MTHEVYEDAPIVQLMEREYYLDDTKALVHFEDHQRRLLNHIFTANDQGQLPYETVVWSTPKKEGKTAIAAAVGYGFLRIYGGNAFSLANDKEQAGERIFDRVVKHLKHLKAVDEERYQAIVHPDYWDRTTKNDMVEFQESDQVNPGPHWLKFIPTAYAGEAGGRQAFTCFDELWAFSCPVVGTRILTEDLRWVLVEDLIPGQRLVGFEEENPRRGGYRSYCSSEVVSNELDWARVIELELNNGDVLTVTPEHPFLGRRTSKEHNEWFRADEAQIGSRIMRPVVPWEVEGSYDEGYIAGALDGEGSLSQVKNKAWRIDFPQNENEMWHEVRVTLDRMGVYYTDAARSRPCRNLQISNKQTAMRVLGQCRPKRLLAKVNVDVLGRMTAYDYPRVVTIRDGGIQRIARLGTTSKTYIMEGYASHNSDAATRFWDEFVPLPIMPVSMRFITTYAGWYGESHLLWGIYEAVVQPDPHDPLIKHGTPVPGLEDLPVYTLGTPYAPGSYLVYWDHENRMPWKSPEYVEGRRQDPAVKGRASEFKRMWLNQWTTGEEAFLPAELVNELVELGREAGLVNHLEHW